MPEQVEAPAQAGIGEQPGLSELSEMSGSPRPIAAAIAVLIEDAWAEHAVAPEHAAMPEARVLLVRRANPPDRGLWGFPGGKIEFGESVHQAALRELKEETGIEAKALQTLTSVDVFERDTVAVPLADVGSAPLTRHFILVAVLCRYCAGEPNPADDALEARWFGASEFTPDFIEHAASRDVHAVFALGLHRLRSLQLP